ncbi:MAG TPA: hypothetical protein VF665_20230 [Longimicrobium sp.]|uniref:hypothetical protein n=1 Tax=Longimicrobium sp. TaxID=2029185 RepID=UPI002EDB5F75
MRVSLSGKASARALLVFGLAGVAAGCNSLLDVDNPATYAAEDLNDPAVVPVLVNGVVGRFQAAYDDLALISAVVTDEAVTGNNFETVQRIDLRQIDKINSGPEVYPPLEFTRAAADSFEARLRRIGPDTADRSLGLARVQAYGALTYALMGEFLCEAPVDPKQAAVSSDSLFRIAITRANSAIATATAFRAAGGLAARADSMINFARVTAARAHLNLGEKAQAAAFAAQVPLAFEMRSFYDITNSNNVFQASAIGSQRNLGVDIAFRNLNDVRVRYNLAGGTGHDAATVLFAPFQPPSFSGFVSTGAVGTGAAFTREASIRISSGLEARYIQAEAEGRNAANIAFLNTRAQAGVYAGQPVLAAGASDAEYLAFLIDQRRRDFFLDGHRQGDLRRYIRLYNLNFYPTGNHPTASRGAYGTSTCFVPTQAEITGNPNYKP